MARFEQWYLDTCQVIHLCHSKGIDCNDVMGRFSALTLEGHVKKGCHTLSVTSIHLFEKLVSELCQAFNRYNFQDVFKWINQLRMKSKESLQDVSSRFIHLCYEFPERDGDWMYLGEKL